MLGLLPDIDDAPAINQALYIPLQPGRPPGAKAALPEKPAEKVPTGTPMAHAAPLRPATPAALPATPLQAVPLARDLRHEATFRVPADADVEDAGR